MILYFLRRPPAKIYPRQIADIVTEPLGLLLIPLVHFDLLILNSACVYLI